MAVPAAPAPMMTDLRLVDVFADNFHGVDESSQRHDGRTVLVVVKHGDVQLALSRSSIQTLRRGDIFEVDRAKTWCDSLDSSNYLVWRVNIECDGTASSPAKCLKSRAFPSITGIEPSKSC